MANKDKSFPLPDELGHSFDEEDQILHFKPNLEYIEPESVNFDPLLMQEAIESISDNKTQAIVDAFQAVKDLAEATQQRVDNRVKALGGMDVKLDPQKDQLVIAAMKRRFPDKTDFSSISYDDYRQCIDKLNSNADVNLAPTTNDIFMAKNDILRTDFGGLNNKQGENRPEISSPANSVAPIDLDAFQKAGVIALFALMLPLIQGETHKAILEHLATAKHF